MNKRTLIYIFLLAQGLCASPNIEQIRNDVSVLEREDITRNLNRSKANSGEDTLVINANSVDIPMDSQEVPSRIKEVPLSKDGLYFSLIQKVENERDKISLIPVKPLKNNHYALKETPSVQKNFSSGSSSSSADAIMSFEGICQFDNVYNIVEEATVNIPCKIDNKIFLLNLTLKPNNSNYELIGVPNFLLFDEYNNGSYSKRIFLDASSSSVKNNSGNSTNITTYFDSRKIDKLLGVTAKEMSASLANGTQQTFQEFKDYKSKESMSYDRNGNVIVTTNTEKPDLATNLTYSAIEGVFRVIEKGVEMLNVDALPALYQIVKGSIINVTLYTKTGSSK